MSSVPVFPQPRKPFPEFMMMGEQQTWREYREDQERHPWPPRDTKRPCGSPTCQNLTTAHYCSPACQTREDALKDQQYAPPEMQDASAMPPDPYSFPDFTTFEATYVGNHEALNGIARTTAEGLFYFIVAGMATGFTCTYSEVALGPGIA
jgi:hypothetical protein